MPTIVRFRNNVIRIYASDHFPPHFHIVGPDGALVVEIATLNVLAQKGRMDSREAMEWAKANTSTLWAEWNRLNA
ncbi:DUF4160 domain-containing protein [Desulfobaculum sp. SPO524]|uniref:DUF4160 domain-containing protein n=1 Tax=Desulfobaculum sp. SPO524 TaxID=3378071 RepID=UPI0038534EE2